MSESRLEAIRARRYDWWNQGAPDPEDARRASEEATADRDYLVARCDQLAAALRHCRDEIRGQRLVGTLKDIPFESKRYWAQVEGVADDALRALEGASPDLERRP